MCRASHGRDTAGAWGPVRAEEHRGAGLAGELARLSPQQSNWAGGPEKVRPSFQDSAVSLDTEGGGRRQGGQQRCTVPWRSWLSDTGHCDSQTGRSVLCPKAVSPQEPSVTP